MSIVVTIEYVTVPASGFTLKAPSPSLHVTVVPELMVPGTTTVNTIIFAEVVSAVTDPTVLVHTGVLP